MDKVLTALGRTFISAGMIVFLFVAYQLWGTGLAESRGQDQLQAEAASLFGDTTAPSDEDGPTTTTEPPKPGETVPPNTTPAPPPAPQGSAVATLKIPKIGLQKAIVEGTSVDDLKKAPGHYTGTPLPGQPGNASLAGHRTTYGAPFNALGELKPGDLIYATTKQGTFTYKVSGSKVVDPSDVSVLAPSTENKLTLTTCHPKYSAAKRLIITALLDNSPAPAAAPADPATTTTAPNTPTSEPSESTVSTAPPTTDLGNAVDASLSGESVDKHPAVLWGIAAALVALITWAGGKLWRRIPAYIIGAPIFLVVLFIFFENFSRLLPANA